MRWTVTFAQNKKTSIEVEGATDEDLIKAVEILARNAANDWIKQQKVGGPKRLDFEIQIK